MRLNAFYSICYKGFEFEPILQVLYVWQCSYMSIVIVGIYGQNEQYFSNAMV